METNEVSTWSVLLACVVLCLAVIALIKTLTRIGKWLKRGEEVKPTLANWGNRLESSSFCFPADGSDSGKAIQPRKQDFFKNLFYELDFPKHILRSSYIDFCVVSGDYKAAIKTAVALMKKDIIKKLEQEHRALCLKYCSTPDIPYNKRIEFAEKMCDYLLNGNKPSKEDSPKTTTP